VTAERLPRSDSPGTDAVVSGDPPAAAHGRLASLTGAWLTPWRATAILAVLLLAAWLFNLFGPEPRLVVSEKTTFITTPLGSDGLPDYSAHMLAAYGPAPPPEENAAVPLLAALWPMDFSGPDLALVCKAIGIPNEKPARPPLMRPDADPLLKLLNGLDELVGDAQSRPWGADEAPEIRDWIDRNAHAIDLLVEAAGRPRYHLPSPSLLRGPPEMLVGLLLPDVQSFRTAARALACRGMAHAGVGRFAEAWRDIHAIHRLAGLLASPDRPTSFLVTQLVAAATSFMADRCTLELLGLPELPDDVLAAIRHDLAALPPRATLADSLASERLMGIDAVVWLRRPGAGANSLANLTGYGPGPDPLALLAPTSLDWNVVTGTMNAAYTGLAEAAGRESFTARKTAADAVEQSFRPTRPTDPLGLAGLAVHLALSRQERSGFVARQLIGMLLPAISSADAALARRECLSDLVRIAAALEAARRADPSRRYPATLAALSPGLLTAVPVDPFSGGPFFYERRGDGYLLYGVGQNLADDGGTDAYGWIVGGEWRDAAGSPIHPTGDIVVRMPMPKRPLRRAR
jgi:hypothetical protein